MIERLLGVDCLECKTPMWAEGYIADDIPLCHACYDIDSLLKHGFVTADELTEQFATVNCDHIYESYCPNCGIESEQS